jgi:uncharacterized membrane protein YczE
LEFGFLLVLAVSAGLGFALRSFVSPRLARACALIGLASLVLGVGILALTATGRSPFTSLTGGLVAAVALGAAGLILPFAFVVGWRRFWNS